MDRESIPARGPAHAVVWPARLSAISAAASECISMKRIVAGFVLFTFAGAAAPARAQIRESAARLAKAAAQRTVVVDLPDDARRRSMARTWAGVGMVAGGLALAFTGQDECVATGLLASEAQSHTFSPGTRYAQTYTFTARNLQAVREHTNAPGFPGCRFVFELDTSIDGAAPQFSQVSVSSDPAVRARFAELYGGAYGRLMGDANVEERRPQARFWTGIGLAAGGALLATLWADVPVAQDIRVGVDPERFTVGARFGF